MSGRRDRICFTDRDLGKRFGEILKSGGLRVERHTDHFADDTADEVWLPEIGKRGWIALTHDRRIHGYASLFNLRNQPILKRTYLANRDIEGNGVQSVEAKQRRSGLQAPIQ